MTTEIRHCFHCDNTSENSSMTLVESGEWVCEDCLSAFYEQCYNCDDYVYFDDMFEYNGDFYCESCRDDLFTRCDRCGSWVDDSDDLEYEDGYGYICSTCQNVLSRNVIQGYSHNQYYPNHDSNFFKVDGENTEQYFGIELEIGGNGERYDCAKEIKKLNPNFFTLKSDSSIPGDGFEIVSKPATYNYHYKHYWNDVCELAKKYHFKSHNINNCGLHIHVSREFFNNDKSALVKLWEIFNNNQYWLEKFARRSASDWAKFKNKSEVDFLKEHGYEDYSNRYQAINNNNDYTIEFRLYKGTLKYNSLIATLQFTKWVCDYVNNNTLEDCEKLILSQVDFSEYSELVQYISERF